MLGTWCCVPELDPFICDLAFLTYDDFHLPASHMGTVIRTIWRLPSSRVTYGNCNLNCETNTCSRNWATWPECGYLVFEWYGMWIWGDFLTFPFDFFWYWVGFEVLFPGGKAAGTRNRPLAPPGATPPLPCVFMACVETTTLGITKKKSSWVFPFAQPFTG
jgi:hypothetical protein